MSQNNGLSVTFKNGKMVITVDMGNERRPSGSGKSMIIASSSGALRVESPDGEDVRVNLNVYVPN